MRTTAAWSAWAMLFLVTAGLVLAGSDRTVTLNYWRAGADWLAGQPLYTGTGHGFIYLPQAACLFVPFSLLPFQAAEICWRLLTIGTYAYGVWRLACLSDRDAPEVLFPLMTAVCVAVAFDAARNGQATLLVTGMIVLAVETLAARQWTRAAVWLCLGIAVKPLGVLLLVLAAVLYPPVRVRLLAGVLMAAVVPFALQRTGYVVSQYTAWATSLGAGAAAGSPEDWAQIFGLLSVAGVRVPALGQMAMQVAAAVGLALVSVSVARRHTRRQAAVWIFVWHACVLMLFSPRTENNTYAVLAPAMGLLFARAWAIERRPLTAAALASLAILMTAGYEIGRRVLPGRPAAWVAPLVAVCFMVYAVTRAARDAPARARDDTDG
jgi:hypothetical protein